MYYVCSNIAGPFTLLEDVKPDHIRMARETNKLLTGDLNASVQGFPPFPGQERHFLRAQIARIRHATCLCPKNLFVLPEEAEGIELNEEYKPLPVSEMSDPANWVHWFASQSLVACKCCPDVLTMQLQIVHHFLYDSLGSLYCATGL
jgi:radial spoke head protein 4/6